MSHLDNKQIESIREAMATRRNTLLEQVRGDLERSGQSQYAEVLGRASGDSADEALAVTLGDLDAARVHHEVTQLRELEAAMARIDHEDFGLCVDCGAAIPVARLLASPSATRCVACQSVHERTFAGGERASL